MERARQRAKGMGFLLFGTKSGSWLIEGLPTGSQRYKKRMQRVQEIIEGTF